MVRERSRRLVTVVHVRPLEIGGGDDGSSKVKEEEVDTAWSARKEERKGKYSRRERRQSRMVGFWKGSR